MAALAGRLCARARGRPCVVRVRASQRAASRVDEDAAFAALGLRVSAVDGCRVRQHVNPLKSTLAAPSPPPEWASAFADAAQPLTLDVGCGSGRYLLMRARQEPEVNFLGVDIRQKLVTRANAWAEELGLANVHFATANATVSLGEWFRSLPAPLTAVSVQFPDPHFKKKHHKRRIVQPQLVDAVVEWLQPGGTVYLASDVYDVAVAMRNHFEREAGHVLELATPPHGESAPVEPPEHEPRVLSAEDEEYESAWGEVWLSDNPNGVPTEREVACMTEGKPCYRMLLRKTA